jgi:hypothetical protein
VTDVARLRAEETRLMDLWESWIEEARQHSVERNEVKDRSAMAKANEYMRQANAIRAEIAFATPIAKQELA